MINKHIQGLAELENEYKTSLSEGLSAREARVRLENENKKNKNRGYSLFVPKKKNGADKLFSFVCSPFAILLLLMAILTAIFGRWYFFFPAPFVFYLSRTSVRKAQGFAIRAKNMPPAYFLNALTVHQEIRKPTPNFSNKRHPSFLVGVVFLISVDLSVADAQPRRVS